MPVICNVFTVAGGKWILFDYDSVVGPSLHESSKLNRELQRTAFLVHKCTLPTYGINTSEPSGNSVCHPL
jgi:hypothetical protein